jgi:hypothetical protein
MNTTEAVLFLVSLGYIFIVFAAGQSAIGDTNDGFDKTSGSKYFSNPDQHILFFSKILSERSPDFQVRVLHLGSGLHRWLYDRGRTMKKWYNYFVSTDSPGGAAGADFSSTGPSGPDAGQKSPAQTVAEIASSVAAEPKFTSPVSKAGTFDEIYQAAEIPPAPQGYSIMKVAEMLQSEHIRSMPTDVKRSTILVALDAAGVDIKDVIQDAVRRDKALDGYERVQERAITDLEARKNQENAQIQSELDKYVAEQRAKIQSNNDDVTKEKERFFGWRLKKQQEEKKISDAVAPFVTENPITGGAGTTLSAPKPATPKQ